MTELSGRTKHPVSASDHKTKSPEPGKGTAIYSDASRGWTHNALLLMLIDLHCHTKYSHDNHVNPEDLIARAMEMGLDGICFTEHHAIQSAWHFSRMKIPEGFLALRGIEISTDAGHLLVYGVDDDSWNRWGRNNFLKLPKVVESVHRLGGICVPAHPYRGWESIGDTVFAFEAFDAIETHNGTNNST